MRQARIDRPNACTDWLSDTNLPEGHGYNTAPQALPCKGARTGRRTVVNTRDRMSKNQTRKPLELKISTVVAVAALLGDSDDKALSAALAQITGGTPDYFEDEFTLLDLGNLNPAPTPGSIDWPKLIALFRTHRLNPVAVRNAPAALEDELRALGLAIDRMEQPRVPQAKSTPAPKPATVSPAPAAEITAVPAATTMIIDSPVRSGQQVYARGGDLIVMATVNPGAEVIADGSIHVYAPLRGRALAGASGNAGARIFSLAMAAELVSIAGVYRTFDEGWPQALAGLPTQVQLRDDKLETRAIALK